MVHRGPRTECILEYPRCSDSGFPQNKSNTTRLPLLAKLVSLSLSCHMMESHKQNNIQQQTLLSSSDITPIVPYLPLGTTLATFHQGNDKFGETGLYVALCM